MLDPAIYTLEADAVVPVWSSQVPSGPQPQVRGLGCTAHDPIEQVVYLMGGITPNQDLYSDLWRLDLQTLAWTQLHDDQAPLAPAPSFSACAFDPNTGYLVVYGGSDFFSGGETDALWIYDTRASAPSWTQVPAASPWPTARGGATFFAPGDGTVVLFGGRYHDPAQGDDVHPRDVGH